jgi:hypothetical protein
MAEGPVKSSRRMLLLLAPAAVAGAQLPDPQTAPFKTDEKGPDVRLPNGKRQLDEILKAEHEQNVRDAHELTALATSFETEMEKTDRFVLSLPLLKKLDDMEKLVRRIRTRIRK